MDKLTISDIPNQVRTITLACEWQYRINGGFIQVFFGEDEENYEIVDVSPSFARGAWINGVSINKLAKKVFTKDALGFIKTSGIKVQGLEGEVDEEFVYAVENSDS